MANIGYARVSTQEQNLDVQLDILRQRCDRVFHDKISSRKENRPGLQNCLDYLRSGDVLTVTKLGRLTRSLSGFLVKLYKNL